MSTELALALAGLVATLLGGAFTAFRYFTAQIEGVRREADGALEKQAESESRSRHALANQMQTTFAAVSAKLERMEGDVVRRQELAQVDARTTAMLHRLDEKMDRLAERIGASAHACTHFVPRPAPEPRA